MSGEAHGLSVVLGATGAIGQVVVARLIDEGHDVLALARSSEDLEALGRRHPTSLRVHAVDITADRSESTIAEAVGGAPVRAVAHLASAPLGGAILETDDSTIALAFAVKVTGLLRVVRALRDGLRRHAMSGSPTRVIAIGGNLGFDPVPDASTAGLANAAQANLVRQLARALGSEGITCHTVAPGPVETPRWRGLAEAEAVRRGIDVGTIAAEAVAGTPAGRLTTPDDVAWAVARLCEPEASVLSGGALILDGGRRTATP